MDVRFLRTRAVAGQAGKTKDSFTRGQRGSEVDSWAGTLCQPEESSDLAVSNIGVDFPHDATRVRIDASPASA